MSQKLSVEALRLPDIKLVRPRIFRDERGFFSETYSRTDLEGAGIVADFVQDNHSLSRAAGVIRGLHFQRPHHAQGKMLRVVRGRILDVVVDVRTGSPTFGAHVSAELSADNWTQIWVPAGFAHGFCTLEPDTEVIYKVTEYYAPQSDGGILWNDPALGIDWPVKPSDAIVSEKDRQLPRLADLGPVFQY